MHSAHALLETVPIHSRARHAQPGGAPAPPETAGPAGAEPAAPAPAGGGALPRPAAGGGAHDMEEAEVMQLVLHWLASGPCSGAARTLEREALSLGLLPKRHDPTGAPPARAGAAP